MVSLDKNLIEKVKKFIFSNGRLLERNLFSYFFESGLKEDVLNALKAYQNKDGGFGNGIEPDLLCPNSTAIGAETALYILDLLEIENHIIFEDLVLWIINALNNEGYIKHPPDGLFDYPHQPWWENPDNKRIFAVAAFLKKFGFEDKNFFSKVRSFYVKTQIPEEIQIYDYPYFIYLKSLGENNEEKKMLQHIIDRLPSIFEKNKEHYPLFGRHWYQALDILDKNVVEDEVNNFFNGLQDDGGLKIIYQNLPWWRPIWTLDGLIILKKNNLIEF